ncbi:glycosyltransferase [Turicibacter sanguinis]|nr:glycosyltransferase [Turicibacter sanguinis]
MKNILFIVSDMESGGFQKSLVSLLQCFDYDKYNVDLLILSPQGIFMNQIPCEVNVLTLNFPRKFFSTFPKGVIELIKEKEFVLALKRMFHFCLSRIDKGKAGIYMSKQIPALNKEYDVAIDYNGQHLLYYMVDKINAKKKITYFHNDYKMWSYYISADKKYYPKVDWIVTISEKCRQSLIELFPECENRIKLIENISSPKIIRKLSRENDEIYDEERINLLTVARPMSSKGYDLAIKACKLLIEQGYNINWYSIGVSNEENKYKEMVKKYGLEKKFIFLGERKNPYIYMRQCDIYVQPSRFEGKSVAIDEAKIIGKPIVVTNFSTVYDQISHEENGLICEMNENSLYEAIKRILDDKTLKVKLVENLKNERLGNETEVFKLYKLIEG